MARQRSRPSRQRRTTQRANQAATVFAWEDDPGAPDGTNTPVTRPAPQLDRDPLPVGIRGSTPEAKQYKPGTSGFRYWAGAEALRRAADMWAGVVPKGTTWHSTVGRKLTAILDAGEDLNAFYDRANLQFFHGSVDGGTFYSGESPDVACHELGHAVLDALRPQLWDAASIETSGFHESFADISALLSALQLESVRTAVLAETNGKLYRSSRLSRLAEQLGWAIRQVRADVVEADCLRNAVNSFFYREPATLLPQAPATELSSEPHSFSRVFTGAFLQSLAGIFALQPRSDADALLAATSDAAQLLVQGVLGSPVVPSYYSQVAAHMIAADADSLAGRYSDALKSGFLAHGILSLDSAVSLARPPAPRRGIAAAGAAARPTAIAEPLPCIALAATGYGLRADLLVHAPSQPKVFAVASAAPDLGSVEPLSHDRAAASFVEDLFRRGRVDIGAHGVKGVGIANPLGRKTHEVRETNEGLVLSRRIFDCGFCEAAESYHDCKPWPRRSDKEM